MNALLNGDEVAVWLGSQEERPDGSKLRLRRAWGVGSELVDVDAIAGFLADGGDSNRGFRWSLADPDGDILCSCDWYAKKSDCLKSLNTLRQHAATAPVRDDAL